MTSFVEHLESIASAPTVEALWALHSEKMASYGFDRLIYGFTRYRSGGSLGDPQDWVLLTNHGDTYMEQFLGKGLLANAPMTNWALENTGSCSWRWMSETDQLTDAEKAVVAFNLSQNVTAGYTVSFVSTNERSKGAAALTAKPGMTQHEVDALWDTYGREIEVMNNMMHLKIQTLPYSQRNLTKRQREVLQWVGDGKTTQDIAILLELTPATIEKHLRLARENLDVETTAQAVLKAAFYNQMFVIESEAA
ncbi:autoinducer binding domain-containing protein [Octadecabacter sp. 1_MG-2023]|uniref:autoinducer binding domain-containing protein n=1 Tax=unclassified Octadecabacter TaxID=196158 RepID=UPI001C0A0062|nr:MULTISPECIES: autoinducer binding domain-containing protein [unclassified Octadecabacter]MBU2993274.1 LuxR family transcriptional regulator [Octadecabacter sp. B2R22]MDO6733271.1 autoinducer binding domain-containing protein [Octadecabacter sp. 1_MG-2023]